MTLHPHCLVHILLLNIAGYINDSIIKPNASVCGLAHFYSIPPDSQIMCHSRHFTFNQPSSELKSHLIHQHFVATTICCIFNCKIECFRTGRPDANAA
jgi:hypothetical protein